MRLKISNDPFKKKLPYPLGRQGGTLVGYLLQDLKVPGSNLDKDKNIYRVRNDVGPLRFKIYAILFVYIQG